MKINLILGIQSDILNGYINVCPFAEKTTNEIVRGSIDRLDDYVDDGEAEEIIAADALEYFTSPAGNLAITHWARKLAHNGLIIIGTTELLEVAKALSNRSISYEDANILLHGANRFPDDLKRYSYTCQQVADMLSARGLKVMQKRVDGFVSFVKGIRP